MNFSPFARHEYLVRDPAATQLEQDGLEASLVGNQPLARRLYLQAESHLPAAGDDEYTADTAAQLGSILRNGAFTFTREGVATGDAEAFKTANLRLTKALGTTAAFTSGMELPNFKQFGPHETPKKPRRELSSAHAATLGLIARTATAAEVTLGSDNPIPGGDVQYGLAHDHARIGTNGYFRVNNAMNGARHERLRGGRLPHTAVWLARAAFGIAWSVKNDRGNLKAAAQTFGKRLWDLRSVATARTSVLERP